MTEDPSPTPTPWSFASAAPTFDSFSRNGGEPDSTELERQHAKHTEHTIFLGVVLFAALTAAPVSPYASLQYQTAGEDVYRIESSQTYSRVRYAGSQRLTITHAGDAWRFDARASYVRDAPDGKGAAHAHFVQTFSPSGGFEDRLDEDPEFLTILNQPFAVRLDRSTLRDIRGLRSAVPFEATSPLGGTALLRGFLRPGTSGPIGGRPTTAVRFDAAGLMAGTLPGHEEASVAGTLRMDGVAYYSADGGLLLGLTVTMTIEARLRQRQPAAQVPVRIVYRRWMRASL